MTKDSTRDETRLVMFVQPAGLTGKAAASTAFCTAESRSSSTSILSIPIARERLAVILGSFAGLGKAGIRCFEVVQDQGCLGGSVHDCEHKTHTYLQTCILCYIIIIMYHTLLHYIILY